MEDRRKPWKKNLYENQGYPDNYTDSSFLIELRKNIHKQDVTYKDAVLGAGRVTGELCSIVIFSVLFYYLHNLWIEPEFLFLETGTVTAIVYSIYIINFRELSYIQQVWKDTKLVVKFLMFGYILSPILKTLTDTISTDTIYATTCFMMLIHLVFFDYKVSAAIVSNSLSLNAAFFGSVCLASRLSSPLHAFVLLTISVECFVLYPFLMHKVTHNFIFLIIAVSLALIALTTVSLIMTFTFILSTFIVNIVFPVLFIRWQRYKENIYGPWDEAIVENNEF